MQYRTNNFEERLISLTIPGLLAIFGLAFATSLTAQEDEGSTDSEELEEVAVEDSDEEEEEEESESADEENMETVTTTATRLLGGDDSANVQIYTQEEIIQSGVTTLDDFFRTVAQQHNSTNTQTSYIRDTGDDLSGDSGGIYGAHDLATVNLHGMGSANTLVLLNGRRVAGYGGSETDIVNILGIPMAAIDRVEIILDGGGAVYGTDALAGVVNFITKRNYRGLTSSYVQENSATGADGATASLNLGLNWDRLSATITLSDRSIEPIINPKTGHSSRYFDYIGVEFDYRYYSIGQPGIVRHWNGSLRYPGPYYSNWYIDQTFFRDPEKLYSYQLPSDHSGLGATIEDFKKGNYLEYDHIEPYDLVPYENGAHQDFDDFVGDVRLYLFEGFELYVDFKSNQRYSFQKRTLPFISVTVPATNAYNPFPEPMHVYYAPGVEQENGLIQTPYTEIQGKDDAATFGFYWDFHENHRLEAGIRESRTVTTSISFSVPLSRERYAPGTAEYYARLASPDPDLAFNFFGNGTHQGRAILDFLGESSRREGTNRVTEIDIFLKGYLWTMMGERVSYVAGHTRRATRYTNRFIALIGLQDYVFDYNAVWNGISEPVYRNETYPLEVWIPLFSAKGMGDDYKGWWGEKLNLTLRSSRSINSTWGAIGGGSGFSYDLVDIEVWSPVTQDWTTVQTYSYSFGGERDTDLILYREGDTVPAIGLVYQYSEEYTAVYNFSRAVQQPDISELYDTYDSFEWVRRDVLDIYDPDGPTLHPEVPYEFSYANIDLESEVTNNHSFRFTWTPNFVPGLEAVFRYQTIELTNKIAHSSTYAAIPEALSSPGLAIRNERGDLISLNYNHFNGLRDETTTTSATITYNLRNSTVGLLRTIVNYNRILEDYDQPFEDLILSDLGKAQAPNRYTASVSTTWDKGNTTVFMTARYTPGYLNERAHYCSYWQKLQQIGRCAQFDIFDFNSYLHLDVGSLTIFDATVTYRFQNNLQIQVGAQNLFARESPITVRNSLPYDPTRWNGRGRVITLNMRYILDQI